MGRDYFGEFLNAATNKINDLAKWVSENTQMFNATDEDSLINLYDFIDSYQRVYQEFKQEYEDMKKDKIGDYNNVIEYINNNGNQMLSIQLNKQEEYSIVPSKRYNRLIFLTDGKHISRSFASNKDILTNTFDVDSSIGSHLMRYVEIFGKYYPLFELYRDSKLGGCLNGEATSFRIDAHNESLINGLDDIEININNTLILGSQCSALIHVDLKDGMNIDYNRCIAKVDNRTFTIPKHIVDYLLQSVKLNREDIGYYNLDKFKDESKQKK